MIQELLGGVCYLALNSKNADKPDSFEYKFKMKQYTKENKPDEDIFIKKCNFDIDSRGGLKLILLDCYLNLQKIIDYNIDYTLLMSDVKEFIPIWVNKGVPEIEENNIYLDVDFLHSAHIKNPIYMVLYNNYLKYKNKYAIWNGVVEKIKFSHLEIEDYKQDPPKTLKYKEYDEIPKEFKDKYDVKFIYEIIQEEN